MSPWPQDSPSYNLAHEETTERIWPFNLQSFTYPSYFIIVWFTVFFSETVSLCSPVASNSVCSPKLIANLGSSSLTSQGMYYHVQLQLPQLKRYLKLLFNYGQYFTQCCSFLNGFKHISHLPHTPTPAPLIGICLILPAYTMPCIPTVQWLHSALLGLLVVVMMPSAGLCKHYI